MEKYNKYKFGSKKILIAGGTGLLGSNLCLEFAKKPLKYKVFSSFNKNKINLENVQTIKCNFENLSDVKKIIELSKPDIVINAIGLANVEECQNKPKLAKKININVAKNLSKLSSKYKFKFIHISTDQLFSGDKNKYSETSSTETLNIYAETKLQAEKIISKTLKNYIIIRTNFYGWGTQFKSSFSDYIIENLMLNKKIQIYNDVFFNPIIINSLFSNIEKLIKIDFKGTINIGSSKKLSKYNFALKIAKLFKLNKKLIVPIKLEDKINKIKISRPHNMFLGTSKLKKTIKNPLTNLNKDLLLLLNQKDSISMYKLRPIIPYGKHHIKQIDINNVIKVLNSGNLTQGPTIEKFEKKFSKLVGSKFAVAVSSASAGLHLAMCTLNLNSNHTVITTPITFVSTLNAAIHNKMQFMFCDIDPNTINICPKNLKKINYKYNAIIPVHFGGVPCDMKKISKLARKNRAYIIEDASHALGTRYNDGSIVGNCKYSDMTVFSFHPVKAIAAGEGGIVTTNSIATYKKLLRLRSHGINKLDDSFEKIDQAYTNKILNPWYYEMQELGYNYRITDIQSSLAMSQLDSLSEFILKRKKIANIYDKEFVKFKNLKILQKEMRQYSSHHLYLIKINYNDIKVSRAELMNFLKLKGIITQVHYIPLNIHPYLQNKEFKKNNIDNAIEYYSECLSIPIYFDLDYSNQKYIINTLRGILQ